MHNKYIVELLENKIADNKTKQAIKDLRGLLKKESNYRKNVINLSARYNQVNDRIMNNLERHSDSEIELNKINDSLLELLALLTEEDFDQEAKLTNNGVENPLLVLCFDLIRKEEMKAFFAPLDFQDVKVELADQYNFEWDESADLTIWDNRDLVHCPTKEFMNTIKESERTRIFRRLPFLEECLSNKPSPHFIHFGEQFFFVNENRGCVNAANSSYSLYARIIETINFINTYRS